MKDKQNYRKLIYSLLVLLLLFVTLISGQLTLPASAVTIGSNVLDDLQKDSSFNLNDYPNNPTDTNIYVIQIAESTDGYLYLYTYQPCQKTRSLLATDVNMSLSDTVDGTQLYELYLVNTSGVFAKYFVKGVKVSDSKTRYYNITSVYRDWDEAIDGKTGTNNTGEKKAFTVHNVYKVSTENGKKQYYREPTYVVNILNPYADFLLYTTSTNLPAIDSIRLSFDSLGAIDAHYIAFSTDWEIDKLLSATVTYTYRSASGEASEFLWWVTDSNIDYGTSKVGYAYPTYDDEAEYTGSVFFGKKTYTWNRIQTVAEFISSEPKLTSETKSNLQGKQWVLRFLETSRKQTETSILGYTKYNVKWTEVKAVSVLRLEFETDGVCYNLGAVSDAVSGDQFSGNTEVKEKEKKWYEKLWDFLQSILNLPINFFKALLNFSWWQWLLLIVGIIGFICLIIAIVKAGFKAVISGIGWFLKQIVKGLWWLICLPFRGIAALFKSKDKEE